MSNENEFSGYSIEELEAKKKKFLKLQQIISGMAILFAIIIGAIAFSKEATQLYPVIGLLLILGIGYPMMTFGPIRKKIQEEMDNRS